MSAVPAEPPHLVQLEIRRTFPDRGRPTRPSPSPPLPRAGHGGQAGDRGLSHAVDESLTRADHAPERREEAPTAPPTNIYLGETYTANVHLSVPADAAPHAAHKVHLVVEMHSGIPPLAIRTGDAPPPLPPAPQIRQYPLSTHDFERIDPSPPPPRAQEIVVPLEWELKELGSHAVVCLVSYGIQVADRETGELQLVMKNYRKILRFEVLNPLSVRTKAHAPSPSFSPNTFYSPLTRSRLFLEVQVQNHCDSRMTFQRMRFEPVEGFHVSDQANEGFVYPETKDESAAQEAGLDFLPLATGSVRQFLYILTRSSSTRLSGDPAAAAAAAQQQQQQESLGRLDIVWQTERGQHGRLQSATLGRKLTLPAPAPSSGPTLSPAPRPGPASEQATSSPVLSRRESGGGVGGTAPSSSGLTLLDGVEDRADVKGFKFDVTVEAIFPSPSPSLRSDTTTATTTAASQATFLANEPVSVRLRIRVARDEHRHHHHRGHQALSNLTTMASGTNVSAAAEESIPPPSSRGRGRGRGRVRVAVQHVQWHPSPIRGQPPLLRHSYVGDDNNDGDEAGDEAGRSTLGVGHGRSRESISSPFAIPGALPPNNVRTQRLPGVTSLQQQQSLLAVTRNNNNNNNNGTAIAAESASFPLVGGNTFVAGHQAAAAAADDEDRNYPMMHGVRLPLPIPIPNRPPPPGPVPSAGVIRLGPDTLDVGYLDVPIDGLSDKDGDVEGGSAGGNLKVVEMRFVPLERGLIRFGGMRVLVLPSASSPSPAAELVEQLAPVEGSKAETVWEASSIAEIWCQ